MEVLRMDDPIDALLTTIFSSLETDMATSPDRIKADLQILSAAKNVERIADHASNVAEDVVYMVEGTILRHRH
jgi:phosphate transport system protein